ncbi:hypothetical protein ACOMHN_016102 [Nucella lapillus]
MGDSEYSPDLVPRLCHVVRWPDFNGYGFNLHAEKGKAGQFIGKVDDGSPAEKAGLKAGDRIVEVNGTNIGNENHQQVVGRIKTGGDETRLLVVDQETDHHYKEEKLVVRGDLPEVKFLTAARDEDEQPQVQDSFPATAAVQEDINGTEPEPEPQLEPQTLTTTMMMTEDSSSTSTQYAPRLCNLVKWPDFDGYGFNLHAEKDKPGQYIGLVDPDSPAELAGLKEGDRIVEVNGENIEKQTHVTVIQKIKSGGDRTSMLVVDRATDEHFKGSGQTICSAMTSVVVISTPPRMAVVDNVLVQQEASQVASSSSYQWDSPPPEEENALEDIECDASAQAEFVMPPPPSPLPEEDSYQYSLPEPSVDLSDTEDTTETVAAAFVAEHVVESAPEPEDPPQSFNGTASNGINGGAVEESRSEPVVKASFEPQPAVINSSSPSAPPSGGGDLNLNLSAAEMKERLKSRKKQDPRQSKTSFETKYKMFEKM